MSCRQAGGVMWLLMVWPGNKKEEINTVQERWMAQNNNCIKGVCGIYKLIIQVAYEEFLYQMRSKKCAANYALAVLLFHYVYI